MKKTMAIYLLPLCHFILAGCTGDDELLSCASIQESAGYGC
ncbi:hypothetical protein [Bacillus sp. FJAT-27916]|nr:hypothetical protein [Bacillus sp. FJAT-27916]